MCVCREGSVYLCLYVLCLDMDLGFPLILLFSMFPALMFEDKNVNG